MVRRSIKPMSKARRCIYVAAKVCVGSADVILNELHQSTLIIFRLHDREVVFLPKYTTEHLLRSPAPCVRLCEPRDADEVHLLSLLSVRMERPNICELQMFENLVLLHGQFPLVFEVLLVCFESDVMLRLVNTNEEMVGDEVLSHEELCVSGQLLHNSGFLPSEVQDSILEVIVLEDALVEIPLLLRRLSSLTHTLKLITVVYGE
mmetsp:Transcript_34236/g.66692  ORF Transcript_34236/g.66692 Transcript_34236/m.66692 type:complete len:205 (-) Transcript_34236:2067-2681(-)